MGPGYRIIALLPFAHMLLHCGNVYLALSISSHRLKSVTKTLRTARSQFIHLVKHWKSKRFLWYCALVGFCIGFAASIRVTAVIWYGILAVFFAFVVPLASLVILHAALYGALRQFLFLVPPMILIAVYGVVEVLRLLIAHRRRFIASGLVLLLLASYALVVVDMVSLHPYEYIYFSPVVGGLPGSANKYEIDYWASCDKAGAQWLAQHYQQYTTKHNPSVQGITYFEQLIMLYLPGNFHVDTQQPDFYVAPMWGNGASSAYRVIHVESSENVPLCVVETKD